MVLVIVDQDGKSPSYINDIRSSQQHQQQEQVSTDHLLIHHQHLSNSALHASPTQCELPCNYRISRTIPMHHNVTMGASTLLTTHSVGAQDKFPEKDISRMNSSINTYDLNQYSPRPNMPSEPSRSDGELSKNEGTQLSISVHGHSQLFTVDKVGQYAQQVYSQDSKNSEDCLPKSDTRICTFSKYQSNFQYYAKKESEHYRNQSMNWVHSNNFLMMMDNNKGSQLNPLQKDQSSHASTQQQQLSQHHHIIDSTQKNTLNYPQHCIMVQENKSMPTTMPNNTSSSSSRSSNMVNHYMSPSKNHILTLNNTIPLTTTSSCTSTKTISTSSLSETNQQITYPTNHHVLQQHMYPSSQHALTTLGSCSGSSCNNSSSGGEENSTTTTSEKVQSSQTKTSNSRSRATKTPRKKYRRSLCIEERDLLRVLHLPQTQACSSLGCSLSTLKRRFYELKDKIGIDKWPQFYNDIRHLEAFPHIYPMSLEFVMNDEQANEKYLSTECMHALSKAFECSTLAKPSQKGYAKLVFADPSHGISKKKKK